MACYHFLAVPTKARSCVAKRCAHCLSGSLAWTLPCVVAGAGYARVIPKAMMTNLSVALLTQALQAWSQSALWVLAGAGIMLAAAALLGMLRPSIVRSWLLAVPAVLSVLLIGTYERVREFIRKPYAIADYLYSNGVRKADYPLLQRDGLLTHATYTSVRQATAKTKWQQVARSSCWPARAATQ